MSDAPRLMKIGSQLVGETPKPPQHLLDVGHEVADAAWRQSHGSLAAYEMLLAEHQRGEIDLISGKPTGKEPQFPIGNGDARLTATGGEVYGRIGQPTPDAELTAAEARHEPMTVADRDRLAALQAMPEEDRTPSETDELAELQARESAT